MSKACLVIVVNEIESCQRFFELNSPQKAFSFVVTLVKRNTNNNILFNSVTVLRKNIEKNGSRALLVATCSNCKYYISSISKNHVNRFDMPDLSELSDFELRSMIYPFLNKKGIKQFKEFLSDSTVFAQKGSRIAVEKQYVMKLKETFLKELES